MPPAAFRSSEAAALLLILGLTAWRLAWLPASDLELYVDEAQYWLWGQEMAAGAWSKPPLVGWLIRAANEAVGSDAPWVARLPWPLVQRLGGFIGWCMWKLPTRASKVTRINLAHCFPELDAAGLERLSRECLRGIGKTLTESACAWIWPAQRSIDLVREVPEALKPRKIAIGDANGTIDNVQQIEQRQAA